MIIKQALQNAIKIAKARGYRVYALKQAIELNEPITWVIIENHEHQLGNVSVSSWFGGAGVDLATIHKPDKDIGSGFRINGYFDALYTSEELANHLSSIFVLAPNWASGEQRERVRKYSSFTEYQEKNRALQYKEI